MSKTSKLRDLSRHWPSPEQSLAMINTLADCPSIVAAIVGATILEHDLETVLRNKFKRHDDETWETLTNDNGVLNTFSQKIDAGYAFGVYNSAIRDNLGIVRRIRNVFAHAKIPVEFDNKLIRSELEKAKAFGDKRMQEVVRDNILPGVAKANAASARSRYVVLCLTLTRYFSEYRVRHLVSQSRRIAKKTKESQAAFQALTGGGLGWLPLPPKGFRGNYLKWFQDHQTGGPIPAVHGQEHAAQTPLSLRESGKKDT